MGSKNYEKECLYCKKVFMTEKRYLNTNKCCSRQCANLLKSKKIPKTCEICNKEFLVKPSHYERRKTCSPNCDSRRRKITNLGKGNPNYGNKGVKSKLFKGEIIERKGYIYEYHPNHPFRCEDGRVRQHRIVAEKYLLTDENSVIINGIKYLSPEYEVHHIDEDKKNNNINNLVVLTKEDHMRLHSTTKQIARDKNTGRFIKEILA